MKLAIKIGEQDYHPHIRVPVDDGTSPWNDELDKPAVTVSFRPATIADRDRIIKQTQKRRQTEKTILTHTSQDSEYAMKRCCRKITGLEDYEIRDGATLWDKQAGNTFFVDLINMIVLKVLGIEEDGEDDPAFLD